ncbi:hypothetical protein [Brevifollis gellanilyticus]|uniref:Uncharacterized protein n=1 Tax=Brevifollis gellanilyticus TaxID=748831 RepID=A0A512MG79_9BACT|nr:hypothetical protein [Brevifollis gellanilyticus]GEP45706.1 hypothetical protein BGE01nite_49970 [Brevifollis gellanilyticus]
MQWYPNGWPGSINLDMVGAKFMVPLATANQSVIRGLGPADLTNTVEKSSLTFMDGLPSSTRNYAVGQFLEKNVILNRRAQRPQWHGPQ